MSGEGHSMSGSEGIKVTCADVEILLADYVDKTLHADQALALELHVKGCADCRALARDIVAATAFMEKAAVPEPPSELINKLIFEITQGPSHAFVKPSLGRRLFGKWGETILQPRMAMGMAMTVLSLGMMLKFVGVKQPSPRDLDPVEIWHSTEDTVTRWWDRAAKYYDSLQVVFEIQTRYDEWVRQKGAAPAESNSNKDKTGGPAK